MGDKIKRLEVNFNIAQRYLKEIRFIPVLEAEEEKHLALKVKAGDQEARKRFIESNLRLVVSIARRYRREGVDLLDLIEEGNLGLIRALEHFDPELGYRFSTYAVWWIRQSIEEALNRLASVVYFPSRVLLKIKKYRRVQNELTQQLGRIPLHTELAKAMELSLGELEEIIQSVGIQVSLDAGEDGNSFIDGLVDERVGNPMSSVQLNSLIDVVDYWLDKLNPLQNEVVARRFGLKNYDKSTLLEISVVMHIPVKQVRKLQEQGLRLLRELAENSGLVDL